MKCSKLLTVTNKLTKAPASVIRQDESWSANALETPGIVNAGTKQADIGVFIALIDV